MVAVTRSIEEFAAVSGRSDKSTAWGLGVHPQLVEAVTNFRVEEFSEGLNKAAIVGEVGIDGRSDVPMELQQNILGEILETLSDSPRLMSIHSRAATEPVLDAIELHETRGVILHWWRGSECETKRAVDLGCYFSVNTAEVANPKVLEFLPQDRVLTETDHPFGDKSQEGSKRPGLVETVEQELAGRWNTTLKGARRQVWSNFLDVASETDSSRLLPTAFQEQMIVA